MKTPIAKQLPSGNWRVQIQVDGQRYSCTAESEDEPSEDKEYIDAEVVDGESSGAADNQKKQEGQSVTIIQQQTNVMQFGEKSVSLVNNGTINIDL